MAYLNTLKTKTLITYEEVNFHDLNVSSLNERQISQHIITAEKEVVIPLLGMDFYNQLLWEKNEEVRVSNIATVRTTFATAALRDTVNDAEKLSTYNKSLWFKCLWKYLSELVLYKALPFIWGEVTKSGVTHAKNLYPSSFDQPIDRTTTVRKNGLDLMRNDLLNRINGLATGVENYLVANASYYPAFAAATAVVETKKFAVVFGIFDDKKGCCGCGNSDTSYTGAGGSGTMLGYISVAQEASPFSTSCPLDYTTMRFNMSQIGGTQETFLDEIELTARVFELTGIPFIFDSGACEFVGSVPDAWITQTIYTQV